MWRNHVGHRTVLKTRVLEVSFLGFYYIPIRVCSSSTDLQTSKTASQTDVTPLKVVPASEVAGKLAGGYDRNDPAMNEPPNKMSSMRHGAVVLPGDQSLEESSVKVNDAEVEEILDESSFQRRVDTQDALKLRAQELLDIAMTRHPPKDFQYWDRHGPNPDIPVPEHYELCNSRPDMRLEDIKIKFLLQCRQHHPEIGGNPVHYIRVCEAFETILAEHGLVMQKGETTNFGAKHQRYLLENYELNKVLLEHDLKVLAKHTEENLSLLLGEANWQDEKARDKPFREKKHLYNVAFRKDREAPDADRAAPGDDAHETMTKEEYQLSLKRADRLMERGNFAGENALVAEAAMWNTKEAKDMQISIFILACIIITLIGMTLISYERALGHSDLIEERPDLASEVLADTALPWWGNDYDYERAVKRFFLEEYRKARNYSNREVIFNEGIGRESLDLSSEKRLDMDSKIFEVSSARLKELQEKVSAVKAERSVPREQLLKEKFPAPPLEEGEIPRIKFTPKMGAPSKQEAEAAAAVANSTTTTSASNTKIVSSSSEEVVGVAAPLMSNGEISLAPPPDHIDRTRVF